MKLESFRYFWNLLNSKQLPQKFHIFLPNMQNYKIQASRKYRYILLENQHPRLFLTKSMTPCQKTSFERAIKKTLRGLLRVCLCLEEKRMPLLGSWTFFQKESTMQSMKKSKINYLPTIHLSQKSVCKTYIHFLVDIFEVLELSHIFIQADEQVYARIIYI